MQFTDKEARLIERLRRQQRNWPLARWLVALIGILVFALCTWMLIVEIESFRERRRGISFVFSEIETTKTEISQREISTMAGLLSIMQDETVESSLFFVVWLPFALFGLWCFAIAIRDWRGNANRTLLLKLLENEARQRPEAGNVSGCSV
jgi:hypothetical protein